MPTLTVLIDDTVSEVRFAPGLSVREILNGAGIPIRSGCLGNGACGLCLVRIEAGEVHEPTGNERLVLSAEQLAAGLRLGCQLTPASDLGIRVQNTVAKYHWRELPAEHFCRGLAPLLAQQPGSPSPETGYGLAIDLGTTHICLALWDLKNRHRVFGRIGLNPQSCRGADVVSRLLAAGESPAVASELARMPLDAVCQALLDMAALHNLSLREIVRVSLVGNTPMLALLTQTDGRRLLQPSSWTQPFVCRPQDLLEWPGQLGIHPRAAITVVPSFAGFVGSDLLAGVLATGLTSRPGSLLIDFGTNSEIALWDGRTLWVTSAAGGPAFEGCGIKCGMPAEAGAIYRIDEGPREAAGFTLQVIGGGPARGLCGSGLVDLIACLRGRGDLLVTGRFAQPMAEDGFVVQRHQADIRLTGRDVDMFQRAKAAIGVGIQTLLARAAMPATALARVQVAGAFGRHLHVRHAKLIGLLPDIESERVELCGNTALAGCEYLLLGPAGQAELEQLRRQAVIVNLAQLSDFETLFMDNLYLRPLTTGNP